MLHMLSLDVTDMCWWVLQTLFFNVVDVVFRCCRHVLLGVVLSRRGKRLLMLDVARITGRNMAAIQSQHGRDVGRIEERLLMLDVARNHVRHTLATRSQHAHNIYSVDLRSNDHKPV
jgi:hypothetical protein